MARGPFDNSVTHRLGYIARILGVPLLCGAVALFAFGRAGAANRAAPERPRVDQPAAVTPVVSARRLASLLAFPERAARLAGPLDQLVAETPAKSSCAVVSTPAGVPIYAHNPLLTVTPASNEKLLTAYAALAILGPDRRFRTTLGTDARVSGGAVQGDLWLIGGGDPVLATKDYAASFLHQPQTFTDFETLLGGLQGAGITRIRGALIADATRYDEQRYVASWPSRFTTGRGENPSGPLTALNLNDGFATFPPAGQEFGGSGTRTTATNPAQTTAQRLADLMKANGITIDGGVKVGKAVSNTNPVSSIDSPPLSEIIQHMLTESDNTTAELLVKEIGVAKAGQGTTAAGTAAITQLLNDHGLAVPGMAILDGSGLADGDKVTCNLLARVLAASGRQGIIAEGLPQAGKTGTLADRFAGTQGVERIRAKTGTLSGVTSLSGWADTSRGANVVFSFVLNGGDEDALKSVEERLALAVLEYPAGPSLEELGPKPPAAAPPTSANPGQSSSPGG